MRASAFGLIVVVAAVFAASSLASGSTPSNEVYQSPGSSVQKTVGTLKPPNVSGSAGAKTVSTPKVTPAPKTSAAPQVAPGTGSQLPFTGLDLAFIVAAGFVLILTGLSLHRVTRKPPTA